MLLKSQFPLTNITSNGYSPIQLASILGRNEIMDLIITYLREQQLRKSYVKQLINEINEKTNMSALSMAIMSNHVQIAEMLI